MNYQWTFGAAVVASLLLSIGCGGRSSDIKKVELKGTVTFDGEKVPNGEIRFYPTGGTKGPVSGGPIRDGQYTARAGGGVPVGEHVVDIRGFRPAKNAPGDSAEGGAVEQYLPIQYNSQSILTVTISPDTRTKDFDLPRKPEG